VGREGGTAGENVRPPDGLAPAVPQRLPLCFRSPHDLFSVIGCWHYDAESNPLTWTEWSYRCHPGRGCLLRAFSRPLLRLWQLTDHGAVDSEAFGNHLDFETLGDELAGLLNQSFMVLGLVFIRTLHPHPHFHPHPGFLRPLQICGIQGPFVRRQKLTDVKCSDPSSLAVRAIVILRS